MTMEESDHGPPPTVDGSVTALQGQDEAVSDLTMEVDEYDLDFDYNEEFEKAIQAVESTSQPQIVLTQVKQPADVTDIEDLGMEPAVETQLSPFSEFRRKGFLSVSDLVGTVWCEVQYDYRLRTMPYLPASQRPDTIKSYAGKEIMVDKAKVEDKERILRRGNTIHKRLEREIHPVEIRVTATTREDVWGLRFLNMLSALDALINIGTCRELPVVGFINGIMVMGIIDEIVRKPISTSLSNPVTPDKRSSLRQANLTSFFSPTKLKPETVEPRRRTHRLYVSDSKTRANGELPRESDTLAGRLQVMLYKELLDTILMASARRSAIPNNGTASGEESSGSGENKITASSATQTQILPSSGLFSFAAVFAHLSLDPAAQLSEEFIFQSRSIIDGNGLRHGAKEARCLNDLVTVWDAYVEMLGLGTPASLPSATSSSTPGRSQYAEGKRKAADGEDTPDLNAGRTEAELALVYRRAGAVKRHRSKGPSRGQLDKKMGKGRGRRKHGSIPIGDSNQVHQTTRGEKEEIPNLRDLEEVAETESMLEIEEEEERILIMAIEESKKTYSLEARGKPSPPNELKPDHASSAVQDENVLPSGHDNNSCWQGQSRTSSEEKEEEELAWAVEMSLGGLDQAMTVGNEGEGVVLRASQQALAGETTEPSTTIDISAEDDGTPEPETPPSSPPSKPGKSSGSIIGKHKFRHDPNLLSRHLESVLEFWMGTREPQGVSLDEARRCAWCEFENDCEWRSKKAKEAWEAVENRRVARSSSVLDTG